MARIGWIAVLLLFLAFWSSASAVPTPSTGSLRLLVFQGEESGPIGGASITVIDPQTSVFRRQAETDASGRAEILDLAPRDYYLRVEKEAYETYQSTFTARPGEMTQRRVVMVRFDAPAPDDSPESTRP
jgi:hypothetical protein